jgi:hypothetical protein
VFHLNMKMGTIVSLLRYEVGAHVTTGG